MSGDVPSASGLVVVTHVYPQQPSPNSAATGALPSVSSGLGKFRRVQPKALGTVQIMIGVLTILLGVVMAIHASPISPYSGIAFWGSLVYIITGALTVAADNKLSWCLVKASLGMSVCSSVVAGLAIILFSIDFVVWRYPGCYSSSDYSARACWEYRQKFTSRSNGLSGVLLVFSLLQFIISICISAFACRATCCRNPEFVQVSYSPHTQPPLLPPPAVPALNTAQPLVPPQYDPNNQSSFLPDDLPPAYTTSQKARDCAPDSSQLTQA